MGLVPKTCKRSNKKKLIGYLIFYTVLQIKTIMAMSNTICPHQMKLFCLLYLRRNRPKAVNSRILWGFIYLFIHGKHETQKHFSSLGERTDVFLVYGLMYYVHDNICTQAKLRTQIKNFHCLRFTHASNRSWNLGTVSTENMTRAFDTNTHAPLACLYCGTIGLMK